jgi:multiple sugar transport system substrate-binding protein
MVISPKLFRAAGLDPVKDAPKTWEDIAAIGPKLTKVQNGAIVQQGYGITSYPIVMALVYDAMIHQLGGSIVSADGSHATINSPAGVKALQTLSDFVNKYKISVLAGKPLQGPGFSTGSSAIISDVGLWYRGYISTAAPKIYDHGNGLMFLPFPRFKGGKDIGGTLYGYAWTVSAHSQHSKEAWQFVKFLSDNSTMGYLAFGIIQPKAAMLNNPKAMANPDVALALRELAAGANYAAIPDQVSTIIYSAVTRTILDKVDAKTSLDQAAQELNSLIPSLSYKLSL